MRFDQVPLTDVVKEKVIDTAAEELPEVQNDAHMGKGLMENLMSIKKGHHHGHDMHHLFHGGGGGYTYQMKQNPSYGHQQWTHHEGGTFPQGLISQMQGCTGQPNQPLNAVLKCTSNSNTCKATCMADYKFPNGETTLLISCVEGEWIVQGAEWPQVPSCERKFIICPINSSY